MHQQCPFLSMVRCQTSVQRSCWPQSIGPFVSCPFPPSHSSDLPTFQDLFTVSNQTWPAQLAGSPSVSCKLPLHPFPLLLRAA